MRIHRLRLENYRRHKKLDLELPDGVLAIVGPNGSGKSSLLEAIGFALFGTQATRTPKAQLRHTDAAPSDAVSVHLTMDLAGQAIEVMRSFRGANLTAQASLTVDGKTLVAPGANSHGAVTQEIERLLGMDRVAFFTSIVAQQKELSKLADLKATERKQLILRMLGVDALDRAIDEARQHRRSSQQRVDDLQETLPDEAAIKQQIVAAKASFAQASEAKAAARKAWTQAQTTLATAQEAHESIQAQAEAHRKAAADHQAASTRLAQVQADANRLAGAARDAEQAQAQAAKLEPLAARRPAATEALARGRRLHDQAATANQAVQEANKLQTALDALDVGPEPGDGAKQQAAQAEAEEALAQRREAVATRRAEMAQVEAHLARIEGADSEEPCPFCAQPLHEQLPRLHQDLIKQRDRCATQQSEADAAVEAAHGELQRRQAEVQAWRARRTAFDRACTEKEHLEARLAETRRRAQQVPERPDLTSLEKAAQEAADAERAYIRLQAQAEALPRLRDELATAQAAVHAAQNEVVEAEACLGRTPTVDPGPSKQALDDARKRERQAERDHQQADTEVQLANKQQEHAAAQRDALAVAKDRLRAASKDLRLWRALAGGRNTGLLEQFRSHLVGKIRPAINAEASRLLGRFTEGRYSEMLLDEDYGVFVVDGGVPYALDRFSGGEADLAHLALRLAVSRLLTRRSGGAELRFLALDEVFGSLDRQRRDAVVAALHSLEGLYAQVVLVTHHEDLREVLDAVLEVRSDGDSSEVRFHQG